MCILSLIIIKPLKHFVISILTQKPYNLLWIVALLMFALSLVQTKSAFDITLHDSYYVLGNALIYRLFALLLIVFWLIYLFASNMLLSTRLTTIHILATLLPALLFITLLKLSWGIPSYSRSYYAINAYKARPDGKALVTYLTIVIIFLAGQLCFFLNLIGGPVKYFLSARKTR